MLETRAARDPVKLTRRVRLTGPEAVWTTYEGIMHEGYGPMMLVYYSQSRDVSTGTHVSVASAPVLMTACCCDSVVVVCGITCESNTFDETTTVMLTRTVIIMITTRRW